jgi:hypothetical protein
MDGTKPTYREMVAESSENLNRFLGALELIQEIDMELAELNKNVDMELKIAINAIREKILGYSK